MIFARFMTKLRYRTKSFFTKANLGNLFQLFNAFRKSIDNNSMLGILWSLIVPLVLFAVMFIVFRARFGSQVKAYPLYLLIGIVCVNFFTISVSYLTKSLFNYKSMVLNMKMIRENIVIANLLIYLYKFLIELFLCFVLSFFYGLFRWEAIFLLVPLIIGFAGLVLGISLGFSLVFCMTRDIEHLWLIMSRIFYFVTPVFYTLDIVPVFTRKLIIYMNPLTPFVVSCRGIFMDISNMDFSMYFYSLAVGVFCLIVGYLLFIEFDSAAIEQI